jgi:hypothetical protein
VPQVEVVQLDGFELSLIFNWSLNGDRRARGGIEQQVVIKIKYPGLRALDDILADVNGLQDLITLAVDAPAVPTEIQLWRPDLVREIRPGKSRPQAVDLYNVSAAEHVREEEPQSRHKMFFPFEQLGGLEAIGRWLTLYLENQYYNVISAAETFHRIRFPNEVMPRAVYMSYRRKLVKAIKSSLGAKTGDWLNEQLLYSNEPRLRARLVELANYAGPAFGWLVGDVELWAKTVTQARNRLTHHDPKQQLGVDHVGLYWLVDSLYVLVMLCLFQECDVSAEAIERIKTARRITFIREQLGGLLQ